MRENRQMANTNLYREDVLQMLFADSDSEGEYLPFGNDDRSSNGRASPGTSLQRNGAAVQGESVHEAQTNDHLDPLPNGDGGGRGERGHSVHRRAVADRERSKGRWQTVQVRSVSRCALRCAMQ